MSAMPARACPICAAPMPGDPERCPACGHAVDPDERAGAAPLQHRCPICAAPLPEDASRCGTCGRVFEPGERPVSHAPGAVAAVIWGALSLFFCGILLGIVAIAQAGRAQQAIALNPELKGAGMARTGQVLGIVAIISNVLGVIYVFATVVGQ